MRRVFASRTRSHQRILSAAADVLVEITSESSTGTTQCVLRTLMNAWYAVRSFDNARPSVHDEHRYTREGEKLPATKFCDGSTADALDQVFAYLAGNWQRMIEEWLR